MTNAEAKGRIKSLLSYMESLDADEEEERDIEALRMAIEALSAPTIPLSVIEDIKTKIEESKYIDKDTRLVENANSSGLSIALDIINKAVEEIKHE